MRKPDTPPGEGVLAAAAHPASGRGMHSAHENEKVWKSGPFLGLLLCGMAGMVAWLVVQALHPVFWTNEGVDEWGFLPLDVQWALDRNNAMLAVAVLGGSIGAALAAGEAWRRHDRKGAFLSAAACGAIGAIAGGLAGYLGFRAFELYKANAEIAELDKAIRVFGTMFSTMGAGVGLGVGAVLGRNLRTALACSLGGLLAGFLASILYPVIVAATMPTALTNVLIPLEVPERLLWFGLPAVLIGLILPRVAQSKQQEDPALHKK